VILAEGLYPTCEDFRLCREELGSDWLVKTQEETLNVIQDARSLFFTRQGKVRQGMKRVEGLDVQRQREYEVVWDEDFDWKGLKWWSFQTTQCFSFTVGLLCHGKNLKGANKLCCFQ